MAEDNVEEVQEDVAMWLWFHARLGESSENGRQQQQRAKEAEKKQEQAEQVIN